MDTAVIVTCIQKELGHAQATASLGREHVKRQRQMIERFEGNGVDATAAKVLLKTLEETQLLHEATVKRLEEELAAFQNGAAIAAQSRRELIRRAENIKETHAVLTSARSTLKDSKSLLNELAERAPDRRF